MGLATIDPQSQSADQALQIPKFGTNRPNGKQAAI